MSMLCQVCGENEARYIDERGRKTCALCPLRTGCDSIRMSNVPALMFWARQYMECDPPDTKIAREQLFTILGRWIS
jgi:hypothetical protein